MNYTRNELVNSTAVMNQMRNSIYHLARFMEKNGVKEIKERLRRMGRNIARTFFNYWRPINIVDTTNVKNVIATIYKQLVNSSVSIEIENIEKLIIINDQKCCLCKVHYEDIEIAGCEILLGLVSEFISLINKETKNPSAIFLEPFEVKKSKAYGNSLCVQVFKYKIGGG